MEYHEDLVVAKMHFKFQALFDQPTFDL